jgi:phosphomannomutase/phosphoglucomutase
MADVPVTHVTPELRIDCPDELKFPIVEACVAAFKATHEVIDIDGARVLFDEGWGLVRASNTQPALVLRCEAQSADGLAQIRAIIEGAVAHEIAKRQ